MEQSILDSPFEYPSRHWELDVKDQPHSLRLVVAIKGHRGEDAKLKTSTTETFWAPGVNRVGSFGRWQFAEFTAVYALQDDLEAAGAAV